MTIAPFPDLPRRMSLSAVQRGRISQPLRVLLYGSEGIGKSTLGANAPDPVFLGAEDGTGQLDVYRFPEPQNWNDVLQAVHELTRTEHAFKTLVIDTLDWIEPLLWRHICQRDHKQNVESYGYGRGYVAALDEWRVFVVALEHLRRAKGTHVVLLAHAIVKTFKNPEGEDYDRFNLKIHEKAGGLLKEWCDAVLFANYETHVLRDGNRGKGIGGGSRFMYTERRAAWDAKNRFGLPAKLPLDWSEFHVLATSNDPDVATKLRDEIESLLPEVAEPKRSDIAAWLSKPGLSVDALRIALNKVHGLRSQQENAQS